MTTRDEPPSVKLAVAAGALQSKGHFARAAEKFAAAAVAAEQELAAEDCLIVAHLRATQASSISFHCRVPTLTIDQRTDGLRTAASDLLPQCISALMRRKEEGTLLPGSCRPAEVAWYRAFHQSNLGGSSAEGARAFADFFGVAVGYETYLFTAAASLRVFTFAAGETQRWHAAFIASALDLLASQPPEPVVIMGKLAANNELTLASSMHQFIDGCMSLVDDRAAATLLINAWRRVERSGVLERRLAGRASRPIDPTRSIIAQLAQVDAEAAVRGLHTCALAGCAAKEVHVSQFKKCGACKTVAYCCKEHQVEDWPAHKAACKAARKAAAPKDNA
jgi:hypothetical protein